MATNIQKSEVVIARILKHLMDNGLQQSMMSFNTLELDNEYEAFFKTSFMWLIHEGMVRSSTNIESITSVFHAYDPVLSGQGFAALGRNLEANGGSITMATAVKETSSSKQSYSGLGDFFGGILGGFTKSMGS